jgi:hypothetical protein
VLVGELADVLKRVGPARKILRAYKFNWKRDIVIPLVIGTVLIVIKIFFEKGKTEPKTPNVSQTVTSPVGPTYQAGGDLTINQSGLSDEDRKMLHDLVKKKSVDGMAEFAGKYRHGYLIFGLSPDGSPVTYQGKLRDVRIEVNWSNLRVKSTESGLLEISMPDIRMQFGGGGGRTYYSNTEKLPFVENETIYSMIVSGMCYEMLDAEKGIFLIGFK